MARSKKMYPSRAEIFEQLADAIVAIERPHPVRVANDGVDTAGKTTLANELVEPIEHRGRPVIRASVDGFHRPRTHRYRRGPVSGEGYYFDSFDYGAVRDSILGSLGTRWQSQISSSGL